LLDASEMVVEGHGPEEISDRDPQTFRDGAQHLIAEVSVPLVETVQEREQWGGLRLGVCDQIVDGRGHLLSVERVD
jgi:hypothetical protein